MNTILTTIAAALVLALVAAFVGPYFVDWTAYRTEFETRASAIVGAPVRVRGSVEARLLPHPSITFNKVEIGASGETARLQAESFALRLFPAPLLRGEVHVRDVDVLAPHLTVELGPDGEVGLPIETASIDPARVTLERVGIEQGTLSIRDPETQRAVTIADIQGEGTASSLIGPFRFDGQASHDDAPYELRLATGRFAGEKTQVRLELASAAIARNLVLDGALSFSGLKPVYEGRAVLNRAATDSTEAWRVEGGVRADPRAVRIDDFDLQVGPDERALRLEGFADLLLGPRTAGKITLTARQLDVDRLLGSSDQPRSAWDAASLLLARTSYVLPALPLTIDLKSDGLLIGQELIQDIDLSLDVEEQGTAIDVIRARATLPGATRAAAEGRLASGPEGLLFKGRAEAQARDLPHLMRWLGAPALPASEVGSLTFLGDVEATSSRVALSEARIALDGQTAEGNVAWTRNANGEASIAADITADRLDLDRLNLAGISRAIGVASSMDIDLDAKTVRYAGIDAKGVSVALAVHDDDVAIRRFALSDIGGAKIDASGDLDVRSGVVHGLLSGTVTASRLDGLAALLQNSPLPRPISDGFARRAVALAPMEANVAFGADPARPGGLVLRAKGKAGGSDVEAEVKLDALTASAAVEAKASVISADANRLLQQMGFAVVALEEGGPGRIVIGAQGPLAQAVTTRLEVDLLETTLATEGDLAFRDGALTGALQTSLTSADISKLAARLGRLPPVALAPLPVVIETRLDVSPAQLAVNDIEGMIDGRGLLGHLAFSGEGWRNVSGDLDLGRLDLAEAAALAVGPLALAEQKDGSVWPSGPVVPSPLNGLTGQIRLSLDEVGLPALPSVREAKMTLVLAPQELRLDQVAGDFAGGRLDASLGFTLIDDGLSLKSAFSLQGADLKMLPWQRAGGEPVIAGAADLSMDLQGNGATIGEAVAGMSGGGSLTARDVTIAALDPAAFARVRAAADEGLDLAPASIAGAFAKEAPKNNLTVTEATGAFTVAGGTIRLSNMAVESSEAELSVLAAVHLPELQLDATISLTPRHLAEVEAAALPRVSFRFGGSIEAPRRDLDVTGFASFLTSEAIEREVKRIKELEGAAQERGRLRREMEARDEARRAEAERRRAAARRTEQERTARQVPDLPPPLEISPPPGFSAPAQPFAISPSQTNAPLILTPQVQQPVAPAR